MPRASSGGRTIAIALLSVAANSANLTAQSPSSSPARPLSAGEQRIKAAADEADKKKRESELMFRLASHVELRRVNGTNYNVGYLKAWLASPKTTPRPLPAWQQIKGTVEKANAEGVFVRIEKVVLEYGNRISRPDPHARTGLVLTNRAEHASETSRGARHVVGRHIDYGPLVFLKRFPIPSDLPLGRHVDCLAMQIGSQDGVDAFDYGEPVAPEKPQTKPEQ
jgi:hypothetical protein